MYLFSFIPVPTFIISSEILRFIDDQPEIRRKRILAIRSWIVETFPEIFESMQNHTPTYRLDDNWISLVSEKNSLSIYLCKSQALNELRKKFPSLIGGKARLTIRDADPFPWKEIRSSIRSVLKYKPKSTDRKGGILTKRNSPSKKTALRQNTRSPKK
ncbi:DUF1801 domain-containing protein [Leptospira yasudae]|uniref:DUF1801 domain-containing protein n=1 Tax=Leptospira yasudae TaxID=2202201 RepID=UPI0010916204|nr:DUF1801 domain-containing protein [Leptospira yasudae]TGM97934.1 DUF1801 domain-containing protein [Leptospira yasudae]